MLYERLLAKSRDNKNKYEVLALGGMVKDFSEYRYVIGKIQGIQETIDIIQETLKGIEEDEH